ncbi:ribonucleoside-triphosphate reductase, adenosylcobalamin-dependent [Lacticaseibacillus baoqingensis]|uniref:Adenosylcobalamin-dependent ribonucleoside-triphosphate reductase n=1 Tax=Lacticaseibacillus baoqingensis TaxID=2486013 RepID=A0ABW4E2M8_9LACO|nr:ribonucleoside-triphosphate reductase, adenosylcobalamin-dependent [Lacticaseibacillus baoqingensis]
MSMTIKLSPQAVAAATATLTPHWGPLGWVTYKRTYARWREPEKRSEEWAETVQRVVEGNINLDPRLQQATPDSPVVVELQAEAMQLFKLIYGLAATPSGRNLWISGSEYQQRNGDALNNCWFIAVRPQAYGDSHIQPFYLHQDTVAPSMPFAFLFDQLMKGGGVGFSVAKANVAQMPVVDQRIDLAITIKHDAKAYAEALPAGAVDASDYEAAHGTEAALRYALPDTREGWVVALAALIDAHFHQVNQAQTARVVLDVSNIRERGTRIHGFGGTASGPAPLIEMLLDVNDILNRRAGTQLSAVDCTDIGNLVGKAVVAGNVRRSAEIALGDSTNDDFITMKQDKEQLYHHRWASNNSVIVTSAFTTYEEVAQAVAQNGEPGMFNLELSRNYGRLVDGQQPGIDGAVEGTNPCGEISLANGEPCNLFEVFPTIATAQGWDLKEVMALAARYTKRVTFSAYDWEVSRRVIAHNRRIGVSLSGLQDWLLAQFGHRVVTGFDAQGQAQYDPEIIQAVDGLYHAVVAADDAYSQLLHCRPSLKHTTVKPSGTVSKLAGVSEGMHFHYSNYLLQRIRFQDTDPLLPALKACGYTIEPDIYTKNTMCVAFPVQAANADDPLFASAGNVAIEEQFATQAFLQTYWSDNAVSCTITFQSAEADKIAGLLRQYRHTIKSTSLLPYAGDVYEQAPKQPITKAQYFAEVAKITDDVQAVYARLHGQEVKDLELVGQEDCATGACPIK